jgi:vancomycin resistance protein YoaR
VRSYLPNKTALGNLIKSAYWFFIGFVLAGAILSSAILFYFQYSYRDRAIPGIFVENIYVGEKNRSEIEEIFQDRNEKLSKSSFIFTVDGLEATISAKTLNIGYDTNLIAEQALGVGKSKSLLSDIYIILASYVNGTFLNGSYTYDRNLLEKELDPLKSTIFREPVNAEFNVQGNRVVAFKESSDGRDINFDLLDAKIKEIIPALAKSENSRIVRVEIAVKITEPEVTTEEANDLGIVEPIGIGTSTYYHSIPSRVFNVALATSKMNGVLIPPGEEFSFVKTLGDVSKFTGYKQAYIIQGGKTVLGDGGGVCQVSTTLFRAVLNAGLPITERHAHAYRVGYYEQDEPPGLDATTYVPTVDFKFKNDTGKHILIQAFADSDNYSLTFVLYGKSDGREITITEPVISNVSAAPPPLYQDDPELPAGTIKQVDFAAPGGKSVFSRTVKRDGKTMIDETFTSVYNPWQAVFLKGTKT